MWTTSQLSHLAFAKLPPRPQVGPALLGLRPSPQAAPGGAVGRSGRDFIGLECGIEPQTQTRAKRAKHGIFRMPWCLATGIWFFP